MRRSDASRAVLTLALCAILTATVAAQDTRVAPAPDSRPAVARLDGHGRLLIRGRPTFIHGWYSDGNIDRLRRLAAGPFNTVLDYGLSARPVDESRRYLDEAARLGVHVIACLADVYPGAPHRTSLGAWTGNDAIADGLVTALRDHPAIIAWYTNDELPLEKHTDIVDFTRRIRALDPSRPLLTVHEHTPLCGVFADTADIMGIDHYPIPQHGPAAVGSYVDATRGVTPTPKPVWAVLQNFAWYQHTTPRLPLIAGDQLTERARLPHPDEWTASRPPTTDEVCAMNYVALAHGAQGLLWWCLYNLDFLPDHAERWQAACRIGAEVKVLEPFLLADTARRLTWSDPRVHAIERVVGGVRVIIAVNVSAEPVRASVACEGPTTPPAASGATAATVMFEDRRCAVDGGKLTDFFSPLARHVYRLPGN